MPAKTRGVTWGIGLMNDEHLNKIDPIAADDAVVISCVRLDSDPTVLVSESRVAHSVPCML